ncbi:MAG: Hemolysin C [Alphaproteobacteria bacterium MarineAlpha5_Bin8]|nr:MAG: Hemolysin C [Alphaproteobacteria bacterium MarineAlpha5_Bin8]PPR46135.1 MAG: Hemolysin C [Alphaproteobacteria bacterium MarineAlpha5_Bin7]|tara:strand:- start:3014 stop:3874 length:861 start_codon:yes stop_codon:yes gene_type:complete
MQEKNQTKKISWRNWLIKKLLINETSKEDILSFITQDDENINLTNQEIEDINEENLITNIIKLNDKSVEDIMVPRAEIVAIEKSKSLNEILLVVEDEAHSRMPVYEKNLDNSLGFLHIKDLLNNINNKDFSLTKILREVLYVAPKSPILELLKRMRSSRIHMGLVVDEFGGVDGLITIEDLVEEIVGEIEDEHDADDVNENQLKRINDNTIIVDASYKILELENLFSIDINSSIDEEVDTVGGLVFFIANKVPKVNEVFKLNNKIRFKVLKADERRIKTLEISKII